MSWHDRVFDDDIGLPWQPQWDAWLWDAWQRSASLSDWPEWDEGLHTYYGAPVQAAGPEYDMAYWAECWFPDFYAPRARFVSDR